MKQDTTCKRSLIKNMFTATAVFSRMVEILSYPRRHLPLVRDAGYAADLRDPCETKDPMPNCIGHLGTTDDGLRRNRCLTAPRGERVALCNSNAESDSMQDVQEPRKRGSFQRRPDPGLWRVGPKFSRAQSCKHLVSQPCVHSRQRRLCDAMHSSLSEKLTF